MLERTLRHCRILVVEDEYMLADELQRELEDAGAIVLGPVGAVEDAIDLIASEREIDGAVLDVNLGGDLVYPAAEMLMERSVAFVFTTGYDASTIPARFEHVVRCEKPINLRKITQAVGREVHPD